MSGRQADQGPIGVPAEAFEPMVLAVMRAHFLAERERIDGATGIEVAQELEKEAEAHASRVLQLLLRTVGPNRDERAKELGWPSSDALVAYLFDGASAGSVN